MERTLILDLHNLAHRAAYAFRNLWAGDTFTGLYHGVFTMIESYMKQMQPTHVAFVSDRIMRPEDAKGMRNSWRISINESYKNRASKRNKEQEKQYQAIQRQLPVLRAALQCLPCYWFEQDMMEADDLIAWLVTEFFKTTENIIVSTDKDLIQLVGPGTTMYYPGAKVQVWITATDFPQQTSRFIESNKKAHPSEHWHPPTPAAWLDYKCCLGDTSDNIEGLKGIGPKWAWNIARAGGFTMARMLWADKKGGKYEYICSDEALRDYDLSKQLSELPSRWMTDMIHRTQHYHGQYPGNYDEFVRWCESLSLQKIQHGVLQERARNGVTVDQMPG